MRTLLFALSLTLSFSASGEADALLCSPLTGCSCTVNASDMNFGNIQIFSGSPATASSDVQVTCTGVIDVAPLVTAKVDAGQNGTIADRQMKSGSNILHYNLYNSSNAIVGDGVSYPMLSISGGLITLGTWSVTEHLNGIIPPTPSAKPGGYSDLVTVRIDW